MRHQPQPAVNVYLARVTHEPVGQARQFQYTLLATLLNLVTWVLAWECEAKPRPVVEVMRRSDERVVARFRYRRESRARKREAALRELLCNTMKPNSAQRQAFLNEVCTIYSDFGDELGIPDSPDGTDGTQARR